MQVDVQVEEPFVDAVSLDWLRTAARATLEGHGDLANAAHARYLEVRRLVLIGRIDGSAAIEDEREDVAMLCRIPGLGKKTAHRLILELREKLPSAEGTRDQIFDDTLSALVNLGYKKSLALEYLEKTYKRGFTDIESLLRETLKELTGNG